MNEISSSSTVGYYTPTEVARMLIKHAEAFNQKIDTIKSTFYRRVSDGSIKALPIERKSHQRAIGYRSTDVDTFFREALPTSRRRRTNVIPKDTKLSTSEKFATSLLDRNDTPFLYSMESEVLGGVEHALSPIQLQQWHMANGQICFFLHDPDNRHNVWGMFVVLPLREDLIFRILKGEIDINSIQTQDILDYQSGDYSCYIASCTVRPEKRHLIEQLIQKMTNNWLSLPSTVCVAKLYASVSSSADSSLHKLVREWYFSRRYDLAPNAWSLLLKDDWQYATALNKYKEEKHMIMVLERRAVKKAVLATRYERATVDDLAETIDIDETLFGPSDIAKDTIVKLRKPWLEVEPESFYVLRKGANIVGYHSMLAIPAEKIEAILREEQRPKDIRPDEIKPFASGQELDIYVIVTGIRRSLNGRVIEGSEKGAYASSLIRGMAHQFEELGKRGVRIRAIYARSRTDDGIKFIRDLGFEELHYSPVHGKHLFRLDIYTAIGEFIQPYKKVLTDYTHKLEV